MQRSNWTPLNGVWRFRYDDARTFTHPSQIESWPMEIIVPFPPESEASGIGDRSFHSLCWYERDFDWEPSSSDRVILHFGAVDYSAKVWVNDRFAVSHEGGHTPFWGDITHLLDPSGKQKVTVQVEDDPHELAKPRGKQDWQLKPHAIWYPRTTGIWQTVWIERVPKNYIEKIRWTPQVETYAIGFEARVIGECAADLTVDVCLRNGEQLLAHDRYQVVDREVDRLIVLSDPDR